MSAGVLLGAAAVQGQADCTVPGFSFMKGQVPDMPTWKDQAIHVGLFTLPYPFQDGRVNHVPPTPSPNLAATASACQADPSCAMFTSDGYNIAAYKAVFAARFKDDRAMSVEDTFCWKRMYYCEQPCCGTWVAEGALEQILAPLPPNTPEGSSGQGLVRTVAKGSEQLPRDRESEDHMFSTLVDTACAGKQYRVMTQGPNSKYGPIPADCPQRCRVACCKQLAEGNKVMDRYHFGQCSAAVCKPCGFTDFGRAAHSVGNMLMRQYQRTKALEAAGAPVAPQQSKTG